MENRIAADPGNIFGRHRGGNPDEEDQAAKDAPGFCGNPGLTRRVAGAGCVVARGRLIQMVDLHCHILPGLDDGPATMEESVAMAESAIADGITHVVATPHSSNEYPFDFAHVRQLRDELQAKVGGRLKITTGCDFHLNPENLGSLRKDAPQYCINQRDFLLLEFNEFSIPPSMDQTLHGIQLTGVRPVITHPDHLDWQAIIRVAQPRIGEIEA